MDLIQCKDLLHRRDLTIKHAYNNCVLQSFTMDLTEGRMLYKVHDNIVRISNLC